MKYIKIFLIIIFIVFTGTVKANSVHRSRVLNDTITISGYLDDITAADTLILEIHGEITTSHEDLCTKRRIQLVKNNEFKFVLTDIKGPTYFSLRSVHKGYRMLGKFVMSPIFYQYLINPGDSICVHCNYYNDATLFTGRGSEKMQCWEEIERLSSLKNMTLQQGGIIINNRKELIRYVFDNGDTLLKYKLKLLESFKQKINENDYATFKADIIGESLQPIYRDLYAGELKLGDSILNYYRDNYLKQPADTDSRHLNTFSAYYSTYLCYKTLADQQYRKLTDTSAVKYGDNYIPLFEQHFKGALLDKILMQHMQQLIRGQKLTPANTEAFFAAVKTPRYRDSVINLRASIGLGTDAGNFGLKNIDDKTVHLSDYKGKVIFVDMWFTGCVGCTAVAHALPGVEEAFKGNENIVFVSLSIDKNRRAWLKIINNGRKKEKPDNSLSYYIGPATKYLYTGGAGSDDAFIKRYNPTRTFPHMLLIDRTGKVIAVDPPRPDMPGGKDALVRMINNALAKN